jgi:hypothetical protein
MFSEETILEEKSLPSSRYPSDHMACLALFTIELAQREMLLIGTRSDDLDGTV